MGASNCGGGGIPAAQVPNPTDGTSMALPPAIFMGKDLGRAIVGLGALCTELHKSRLMFIIVMLSTPNAGQSGWGSIEG